MNILEALDTIKDYCDSHPCCNMECMFYTGDKYTPCEFVTNKKPPQMWVITDTNGGKRDE